MSAMAVRSKVWLEVDGEPLLGEGREQLLNLVEQTGSISAAARAMGITYRKAWGHLQAMEGKLGFPLVLRQKGGAGGGESLLTPQAAQLLAAFALLRRDVNATVDARFAQLFAVREEGDRG
jgi:molybdate transport system regulatory protein